MIDKIKKEMKQLSSQLESLEALVKKLENTPSKVFKFDYIYTRKDYDSLYKIVCGKSTNNKFKFLNLTCGNYFQNELSKLQNNYLYLKDAFLTSEEMDTLTGGKSKEFTPLYLPKKKNLKVVTCFKDIEYNLVHQDGKWFFTNQIFPPYKVGLGIAKVDREEYLQEMIYQGLKIYNV